MRLMEAALDLIAERGEEGVTLRELTDAADANVAAVSYHFGSLKALCDAAIGQALEGYLDAQQAAVSALAPDSTLEELAAVFARPMITALTTGGRDRAVIRIVARSGIDPPGQVGPVRRQVRPDPGGRAPGPEGELARRQGLGIDLPHALRGRNVELARPRTRRGRARRQVREASRPAGGPDRRRCVSRHELGLSRQPAGTASSSSPKQFKRPLDKMAAPEISSSKRLN